MIRLPSIPQLDGSPVNMPGVRTEAVAAQATALTGLGRQLAEVSDQFFGTAVQMQKLKNSRRASELRQQLDAEYSGLQLELQKDLDPESRLKRTQEFIESRRGMFEAEDLPPAMREEMGQFYSNFATKATVSAAEQAARLEIRKGKAVFENEIAAGMKSRDRSKVELGVKTAIDAGLLMPEEGEPFLRNFDEQEAFQTMRDQVQANPIAAEREMNSSEWNPPGLTDAQKSALKREAEQEANRMRSDFVNDMIIDGATPTLDDLKELEEGGMIDKSTHARWASKIRSEKADAPTAVDPAIYEETYTQIMEYDPATDPSGMVEARLRGWIASQPLPKEAITELNSRLTARTKPEEATGPLAGYERDFASKIRSEFSRGDFGNYRYPFDHDDNPSTAPIMRVNKDQYDAAWKARGQFAEAWRAEIQKLPENSTFEQVEAAYRSLKESFKDRTPAPTLDFGTRPPLPFDPDTTFQKIQAPETFGGQPVKAPGGVYQDAAGTVFGGTNDPADNGLSAFGGKTGPGGKEGVAIPQKLLASKFPGKDKAWLAENVRTVVRAPNGTMRVFPVADLGTAEWVWERAGRPTLDLTEGAAKAIGGEVIYKDGKMSGVKGLEKLNFAVVSIDTGDTPLAGTIWEQAKAAWFKSNKPASMTQADHGMIALREAWNLANAAVEQSGDDLSMVLSPKNSINL